MQSLIIIKKKPNIHPVCHCCGQLLTLQMEMFSFSPKDPLAKQQTRKKR